MSTKDRSELQIAKQPLALHSMSRLRKAAGAGALCAAALVLLAGCEDGEARGLARADDLAFEGRYEEAIYVLDELLARLEDSTDPESKALRLHALSNAGRFSHLFLRRPDKALGYYRLITQLSPGSDEAFDARERMARIHLESGDKMGAIAQFQALVGGFPEKEGIVRFQYDLAFTYFAAGALDQARTELRLLLERWPKSEYGDRVRMLMATTHHVQGEMEQALEAYREVREKTEDSELAVRALFEEAGCLASLKKEEEALEAYLEVLRSHPEPRLVRMRLDRLRSRMAKRDIENLGRPW